MSLQIDYDVLFYNITTNITNTTNTTVISDDVFKQVTLVDMLIIFGIIGCLITLATFGNDNSGYSISDGAGRATTRRAARGQGIMAGIADVNVASNRAELRRGARGQGDFGSIL